MKTRATITALLIAGASFAQQAEIVNGFDGFETWVNAETGELPEYWDGFNKNVMFNGMPVGTIECVAKSAADPYEGIFSAQLTSTSIMGGPAVPGILTTGDFVVDWTAQDGDVVGGEAYTQLPQELYGQFKYAPAGVDTGFVAVWFMENGNEVGRGRFEFTETTGGWTAFSVAIDYDPGAAPDSMNMMFSSTKAEANLPIGTVLDIDAIGFGSFVSVDNLEMGKVRCFPNPTTDSFSVSLAQEFKGSLQLFNVQGSVVLEKEVDGNHTDFDVSGMPAGVYRLRIDDGDLILSETIVIQ